MLKTLKIEKGQVKGVVPKKGKGDIIQLTVEVPYSDGVMNGLCEAMMKADGPASLIISYDLHPLYEEGDLAQGEMFEEEKSASRCRGCGAYIEDTEETTCPNCGLGSAFGESLEGDDSGLPEPPATKEERDVQVAVDDTSGGDPEELEIDNE